MKPLIYAEYMRRDRAMPSHVFRHHVRQDWQADGDVIVANLARTMKMGAEPHHMCWWRIPSIERMDTWEDFFRTPEGRAYAAQSPVAQAVDFYECGLFDILVDPAIAPGALILAEFFDPGTQKPGALEKIFRAREKSSAAARLSGLLIRLGMMGPPPGGIAVWSFSSYAESEPFLRQQLASGVPITAAGFYRPLGEDIA
ncbi:hypothetical protein [Aestuariivirga sp.]|uniref:hypothetical protein n=1 Tax=Aestuariivirga sp. TaxID=2650926 RepID=UPI0039E35BA9